MTAPRQLDPVVQHYLEVILFLEQIMLSRTPKLLRPAGLKVTERRQLAQLLAQGHKTYDMAKAARTRMS